MTNTQMLSFMADENDEEYGSDFALAVLNPIEATLAAYAAGEIELEEPATGSGSRSDAIRYAGGANPGVGTSKPYTALTVAKARGWTNN